jgi:DNA repair exonuclease SbcCD ATPase subunit
MIPQRVTLQNFLSFSQKQEIIFSDDEPLWCICGPNGVGKSAVFDAITYCLYGEHRGSGAGVPLIRHGENGFSVSFEFRLHDTDYRICRNRPRRGQPTQSVERRTADGAWKTVPDLNGVAEVNEWVVSTLGIGYESFKASVMLRQGEANNVVEATGSERHKILSKVIGLERFETLAANVDAQAKEKRGKLKALKDRISQMPEVTPEQIEHAGAAKAAAEAACEAADAARSFASRNVADAERWAEIRAEIDKLEKEIAAAGERAAHAEEIRRKHERLCELEPVLEHLQRWLDVAAELAANGSARSGLSSELAAAEAALSEAEQRCRDAEARTSLDRQLATLEGHCRLAEESERYTHQLAQLPGDLAEQLETAQRDFQTATTEERNAGEHHTLIRSRLKDARAVAERIAGLEVGIECTRCGQLVSAEHAALERASANTEVETLHAELLEAERGHAATRKRLSAASGDLERVRNQWIEYGRLRGLEEASRSSLRTVGISTPAAELRRQAEEVRLLREAIPVQKGDATVEFTRAGKLYERLKQRSTELDTAAAALRAHQDALAAMLDPRYHSASAEELASLKSEASALRSANVGEQYRELMGDIQRRQDRLDRLAEWHAKANDLPLEARVPVSEARRAETRAGEAVKQARHELDAANESLRSLNTQLTEYTSVREQILGAETEDRIHEKLAKHLGTGGLQRELMREAEAEIVRHADGIVRNLSSGDLSLELNPSEKKEKEALVLQVRRAESPDPIPVEYLSGSQKFRVAISIALAIGRFATGQTRPLESVIIDEGFGSLDKDGLEATANELKRLKNYLKRIILVSHQDEFIEHFPATIRLKPGETGTAVEAYRAV